MIDLSIWENRVATARATKAIAEKMLATDTDSLKKAQAKLESFEKAQVFLQTVAQETQSQIAYHLEDIVNAALDAVFPDRYTFKVIFEMKRNKTEARLALYKGGFEMDPMSSNGGGVKDVLSFALRIAMLLISKNRKVLILDEVFKWIDAENKPRAYEILKKLCDELDLQVIAVTHDEAMVDISDRVFKIKIEEGVSIYGIE